MKAARFKVSNSVRLRWAANKSSAARAPNGLKNKEKGHQGGHRQAAQQAVAQNRGLADTTGGQHRHLTVDIQAAIGQQYGDK